MRTRVECNLVVLGQLFGDIHAHVVEITEWRHGAHLAVREQLPELPLARKHDFIRADGLLEVAPIYSS